MLRTASGTKGHVRYSIIAEGAVLFIDEQLSLLQEVTEEEIKHVVWSIPIHKSPGPDGFGSGFYRSAWEIIKDDVVEIVRQFFKTGKLHSALNSTHLTLLPKCDQPTTAADFRPIACCGVLYKAIAKLLSNKLQSLLPSLINQSQAAFVSDRNILHNVLIGAELV